jgi:SAM-dependent methyltransferase
LNAPLLTRHESCPICGGRHRPHLLGTEDLHYGIAGTWDYHRCSACDVVFLDPAPTARFLEDAYDDSYYSYQPFSMRKPWQRLLRRIAGYNLGETGDPRFAAPGRVLDIGCGSGEFLWKMKAAGWETHGVEISARAAESGNRMHDLRIQAGTMATATLPAAYFDYVRLNHSFEHILDPHETLDSIGRVLADAGLLFIGVPNVDGVAPRVFGKYWWNLGPPVHPFNYSKRALRRLLEQHGFEIVTCRTNSSFAGVLGSLQMAWNARRGLRKDTGAWLTNPVAKVLTQWLAKLSDLAGAGDCLEIVARKRAAPATPRA